MSSNRPTAEQTAYLRTLARACRPDVHLATDTIAASAEIRRLKSAKTNGFAFADLDAEQAAREAHGDVAIVQPWEIAGRGSAATWRQQS